jgi:ribosomal protein S27E
MGTVSDYFKAVVHKDYTPRTYRCLICGREFLTRSGARQHIKNKHPEKINK